MDLLTLAMTALLRSTTLLLPQGRRQWGEAVRSEAGNVPAGRDRLSWLAGGLWLVAREVGMIRRIGYTMTAAGAGAILVWLDWHPGSENVASPTNRLTMGIVVCMLAVLPWILRPLFGPAADNRPARIVRVGGYLTIYALLLVTVGLSRFASSRLDHMRAFDQAQWDADMRNQAIVGAVLIIGLFGSYAATILILTSRRTSVAPTTLAAGVGLGTVGAVVAYGLMPFGNLRHPDNAWLSAGYLIALLLAILGAPVAAGRLAARRMAIRPERRGEAGYLAGDTAAVDAARTRAGVLAGLLAGGAAALLLAILTITTMVLLPRQVELKWANPNPSVPHGTEFELQMSVGDAAAKYEVGLLVLPLLGLVLGAAGGAGMGREAAAPPQGAEKPELAPTP